jgi:hypothetical protein
VPRWFWRRWWAKVKETPDEFTSCMVVTVTSKLYLVMEVGTLNVYSASVVGPYQYRVGDSVRVQFPRGDRTQGWIIGRRA